MHYIIFFHFFSFGSRNLLKIKIYPIIIIIRAITTNEISEAYNQKNFTSFFQECQNFFEQPTIKNELRTKKIKISRKRYLLSE